MSLPAGNCSLKSITKEHLCPRVHLHSGHTFLGAAKLPNFSPALPLVGLFCTHSNILTSRQDPVTASLRVTPWLPSPAKSLYIRWDGLYIQALGPGPTLTCHSSHTFASSWFRQRLSWAFCLHVCCCLPRSPCHPSPEALLHHGYPQTPGNLPASASLCNFLNSPSPMRA